MFRKLRAIAGLGSLEPIYAATIKETENELLDLLRSQLSQGESGYEQMPEYANRKYAERKQQLGSKAPFGIVDLKLSGSFQDKLKLIMTRRGARIRSSDKKSPELLRKYGKEIFMLNIENQSTYVSEIFNPLLIKKIKDELRK